MDARWFRNSFIWLIVMVFVLAIAFKVFQGQNSQTRTVGVTGPGGLVQTLERDIQAGRSVILTQDGDAVTAQEQGRSYKLQTTVSTNADISTVLKDNGVPFGGRRY